MQNEKNFLDWVGIYPYFRAPNLHCYEKIFTLTNNSIFHYFITRNRPDQPTSKKLHLVLKPALMYLI